MPTPELRREIEAAHEEAAAAHERCAELHLRAAEVWERQGDSDRAEEHRTAAALDTRLALAERRAVLQYTR